MTLLPDKNEKIRGYDDIILLFARPREIWRVLPLVARYLFFILFLLEGYWRESQLFYKFNHCTCCNEPHQDHHNQGKYHEANLEQYTLCSLDHGWSLEQPSGKRKSYISSQHSGVTPVWKKTLKLTLFLKIFHKTRGLVVFLEVSSPCLMVLIYISFKANKR